MTNSDYTDITVLLDRSGSMASIKTDMEGGFSVFLEDQVNLPGKCLLTLAQFDTQYDVVYEGLDIKIVPRLDLQPRGGTALLDAMGRLITETGERLAKLKEDQRPGNVIFVIITDGEENSSHEWTHERVMELVKRQTDDYQWNFTYIGANQDAIAVGRSIGVPMASSLTYDQGAAPMAFAAASAAVGRTRTTGEALNYTQAERDEAGKKPAKKTARKLP